MNSGCRLSAAGHSFSSHFTHPLHCCVVLLDSPEFLTCHEGPLLSAYSFCNFSQSRTASSPSPLRPAGWCQWPGTQCPSPGWRVLSGIPGFSGEAKDFTLQFLISCWKQMWARRSSSLLSKAYTLASRMLGREDPCSRDCSRCLIPSRLPWYFLPCWGGCIDGGRDGLCQNRGWCLSPPPFPQCLHRCLHLKTLTGQAAESAGGESTKLSRPFLYPDEQPVVTCHHCPILFKKVQLTFVKINVKCINLHKYSKAIRGATGEVCTF